MGPLSKSTPRHATQAAWGWFVQTEASDRQFWASEWAGLEANLLQLEAITNEQVAATDKTAKPSGTGKSKKELAVAASKEINLNPRVTGTKRSSLTLMTGKKINLNPTKVADLLPAL